MVEAKKLGIDVKPPKDKCDDVKCPFHGELKVRGRTIKGFIVSRDIHTSATLETEKMNYVKKYERHLKKRMKLRVHNPHCINAQVGDEVKAMECRPLSKTKHFVIVEKCRHDIFVEQKIKEIEEEKKAKKGNNDNKNNQEDKKE